MRSQEQGDPLKMRLRDVRRISMQADFLWLLALLAVAYHFDAPTWSYPLFVAIASRASRFEDRAQFDQLKSELLEELKTREPAP